MVCPRLSAPKWFTRSNIASHTRTPQSGLHEENKWFARHSLMKRFTRSKGASQTRTLSNGFHDEIKRFARISTQKWFTRSKGAIRTDTPYSGLHEALKWFTRGSFPRNGFPEAKKHHAHAVPEVVCTKKISGLHTALLSEVVYKKQRGITHTHFLKWFT